MSRAKTKAVFANYIQNDKSPFSQSTVQLIYILRLSNNLFSF